MSLDLTILPLRGPRDLGETSVLTYNRLQFNGDYRLFAQIIEMDDYDAAFAENKPTIKPLPIPPQMWVIMYDDEGLKSTRTDANGAELTFVYAQELKKLKLPEDVTSRNRAIKAFIDALPNDTPIILYWS